LFGDKIETWIFRRGDVLRASGKLGHKSQPHQVFGPPAHVRNIDFQSVSPAGWQPAGAEAWKTSQTAENISAGRTGQSPMFPRTSACVEPPITGHFPPITRLRASRLAVSRRASTALPLCTATQRRGYNQSPAFAEATAWQADHRSLESFVLRKFLRPGRRSRTTPRRWLRPRCRRRSRRGSWGWGWCCCSCSCRCCCRSSRWCW